MKPKFYIIGGVVLAFLTSLLLFFYIMGMDKGQEEVMVKPKVEKWVKLVVAAEDIPANSIISRGMISLKRFPKELLSEEAFTDPKMVEGSMSKRLIKKDSLILSSYLYLGTRLAYVVPKGRRAVTILIDRPGALSYLIKAGDRVDVIGTFDEGFTGEEEMAKIIIQNAEVLATGQHYIPQEGGDKPPVIFETVTLAVTPNEAERLALGADRASRFRLALRNPAQKGHTWTGGATPTTLLGRRPKRVKQVEIYKGTTKEVETIE